MEPPDSTPIEHEHCGELLKHAKEVEQQDTKYEAIENLKKVYDESTKERGDKQQDTNFFLAFGLLHIVQNQVKTAIKWFGEAFTLAKEQEDKKQEIEASMNLACAYKLDNQFQMAMIYDKNVEDIAEEQKDRSRENMAKKLEIEELSKIIESPELWKWEKSSLVHREMFIRLLQYAKIYPEDIKEINEVRFCSSKEFLIGMGRDGTRVYVGLRKDGHEMAVKRLPKDACAHLAEQEKKVSDELNVAKSNYVVNYLSLDSDSDKEFLFLIMDLCEETLENFVHRSSLDELVTTAPDIIRHILKGLADLHYGSMPILHRDVQPSNILRNVHGNWLLADFGISRILTDDSDTHRTSQGGMEGCNWRAVESSYPSSDDTGVRYKKESDIQVAGMVAFYVVTKGQHPFGGKPDQPRNLLDGKPVGLETLKDPVLKDLLSWMLSRDPEDRPSAEEALKHPYLQPKKQQFKMLCKVGKEREIQMQDGKSDVVQQLNSDPADWKTLISADVLTYFCSDFLNGSPKTVYYGSSWTECLRFIENVSRQWHDQTRPKPQPDAFYSMSDPEEYFLNIFPTLVVRVHRIIRSSDWKERADIKGYFTKGYDDDDLAHAETKQKHDEIHKKNSWFKDTFLDSKRKLKEEIHEELKRFPWFCKRGAYGITGPNKKIPRLHLFLTVKRGMKKSVVRRDLEDKFNCDAKECFELLQEHNRKPKIKYLGDSNESSAESSVSSSVLTGTPSPGGGVLACINSSCGDPNPLRIPEENEREDSPEVQGTGTLTIFCCFSKGQHYALTCFHVGCASDEMRLNAIFNSNEILNSLPQSVDEAKRKTYWFTDGRSDNTNEPIWYGDDGSNYTLLGDFHDSHFDSECDILAIKVREDTKIDCKIADVTSRDWDSIWDDLIELIESPNAVKVEKIGISSSLTDGRIVAYDVSVDNLFKNAIAVKGKSGPFLKSGDSGSPVFFHDKNDQKQVFAYGVYESDDLDLPEQPEPKDFTTSSSDNDSDNVCEVDDLLSPEQPVSTSSTLREKASPEQSTSSNDNYSDDVWEMDDLSPEQPKSTSSTLHENASPEQATSSDDNGSDGSSSWSEECNSSDDSDRQEDTTGPFFICLRLDTALEKLGFDEAACVNDCGQN